MSSEIHKGSKVSIAAACFSIYAFAELKKELKNFAKVSLKPGETKTVSMDITRQDLKFWDEATHAWKAEPGKFKAYVCASAEDVRGTVVFNYAGK